MILSSNLNANITKHIFFVGPQWSMSERNVYASLHLKHLHLDAQ